MNMKKTKLLFHSIINSLGVLGYVFLVVLLLTNGQKFFGQANNLPFCNYDYNFLCFGIIEIIQI